MVINLETSVPSFAGSEQIQALAATAFNVLRGRGMFMSNDTPIRVPLADLVAFLVEREGASESDVTAMLDENGATFGRETTDGVAFVTTTRSGRAPLNVQAPSSHSLNERFMTPEPKVERPPRPVVERPRVDPSWATYSVPDLGDEEDLAEDELETTEEDVVVLVEEAAPAPQEPAAASAAAAAAPETINAEAIAPETVDAEAIAPETVEPVEAVAEPAPEEAPEEAPVEAVEEPAVATPDPAPAPAPAPTRVPAAPATDFSGVDDNELAATLQSQLASDPRIAFFAGQWMAEERVERLGRNDVRRIKEYISEQEQPLTDSTLVQDILNVRPNSVNFETMQFSLNYRLFKDHRDFDFVGTNNQRFWSTSSLPQIGTTRRKPNEIGTDYRFLVDEVPGGIEHRSIESVSRVLSFYEYSLGLLPFDAEMQQLLPGPVLPDQRSAVLTFEIPQLYTTYLVELRYPTPNRGGFLLGLDDFYAESLVPGAFVSITATENDGHYRVEFLPGKEQSARLLDLDDRRTPRYHFRPTSFACEVAPEWLISEDRFPRLGTERPLDDKARRRLDTVVETTFERVGIEDGDSLMSTFDELLTAVNIERPFSETLLRETLEANSKITADDDTYTYAR